jgi:hypothetical protein
MILIVRTVVIKKFMLLNLFGPLKKNIILVHLLSRLVKVGKKKLNLLLMFPSVIVSLMNYLSLEILKILILCLHLMKSLRRAYCKFHNSYSHAINDCNVFRRQIQSAINEGCLMLHEMQVDKQPFPINTMEL